MSSKKNFILKDFIHNVETLSPSLELSISELKACTILEHLAKFEDMTGEDILNITDEEIDIMDAMLDFSPAVSVKLSSMYSATVFKDLVSDFGNNKAKTKEDLF